VSNPFSNQKFTRKRVPQLRGKISRNRGTLTP
jgi:hypothetical protein